MAYVGDFANVLDGLGCGKTCACTSCRAGSSLSDWSEWYVRDDEDDEEDEDDGDDKEDDVTRMSGALTPEQIALEHRIARARELWRPVVQGGIGRYVDHQLGAAGHPLRLGVHPFDLASAQHLGWVGLTAPAGSLGSRLVDSIKTCLIELGKPNLIGRAGAMAACLAGFLAGPEAAPLVWTCLKIMGVVLTLTTVAQLLVCVAAKMSARPAPAGA
jgi:hypothetical protein